MWQGPCPARVGKRRSLHSLPPAQACAGSGQRQPGTGFLHLRTWLVRIKLSVSVSSRAPTGNISPTRCRLQVYPATTKASRAEQKNEKVTGRFLRPPTCCWQRLHPSVVTAQGVQRSPPYGAHGCKSIPGPPVHRELARSSGRERCSAQAFTTANKFKKNPNTFKPINTSKTKYLQFVKTNEFFPLWKQRVML